MANRAMNRGLRRQLVVAAALMSPLWTPQATRAQGPTWTYQGVAVTYPAGWKSADPSGAKQYSPSAATRIPGSFFTRRAAGVLRARNLSASVYSMGPLGPGAELWQIADRLGNRTEASYEVVDRYAFAADGPFMLAYRFQNSGDPVTQAVILFAGPQRMVFMLEVTGHRDDEALLLGEARQLTHSIRVGSDP